MALTSAALVLALLTGQQAPELDVIVMNWWDADEGKNTHVQRQDAWLTDPSSKHLDFDIAGMYELAFDRKTSGSRDIQDPRLLDCHGVKRHALPCLAKTLGKNAVVPPFHVSYGGEAGVLARSNVLEPLGPAFEIPLPIGTILGFEGSSPLERKMIGRRYKVRGTNISFHFYSVHLATHKCINCRIDSTRKIVDITHDYYVSGDYPPIVVGDFKDYEERLAQDEHLKVRAKMESSFIDAGFSKHSSYQNILHVWVGRTDKFCISPGHWSIASYSEDHSVTLKRRLGKKVLRISDHPVVAAKLRAVPGKEPKSLPLVRRPNGGKMHVRTSTKVSVPPPGRMLQFRGP
jgi:hypothetical protein